MLVIFKSKAAADIIMYEKNARPILELLGKDVKQGIIPPEQMADVIAKLEAEVERQKAIEAEQKAREEEKEAARRAEAEAKGIWEEEMKENERPREEKISYAARAYPFLEMLRAAQKKEREIVWGV